MAGIQVGAHVSSAGGIFHAIERAQAIKAEALQIFASSPQMWRTTRHTPEALAQFRAMHAASGLGEAWIHNSRTSRRRPRSNWSSRSPRW